MVLVTHTCVVVVELKNWHGKALTSHGGHWYVDGNETTWLDEGLAQPLDLDGEPGSLAADLAIWGFVLLAVLVGAARVGRLAVGVLLAVADLLLQPPVEGATVRAGPSSRPTSRSTRPSGRSRTGTRRWDALNMAVAPGQAAKRKCPWRALLRFRSTLGRPCGRPSREAWADRSAARTAAQGTSCPGGSRDVPVPP